MSIKPDPALADVLENNQRDAFEEKAYHHYFCSQIDGGGNLAKDAVDKATLLKRDPDDNEDYERPEISAMWFGWQMALGVL